MADDELADANMRPRRAVRRRRLRVAAHGPVRGRSAWRRGTASAFGCPARPRGPAPGSRRRSACRRRSSPPVCPPTRPGRSVSPCPQACPRKAVRRRSAPPGRRQWRPAHTDVCAGHGGGRARKHATAARDTSAAGGQSTLFPGKPPVNGNTTHGLPTRRPGSSLRPKARRPPRRRRVASSTTAPRRRRRARRPREGARPPGEQARLDQEAAARRDRMSGGQGLTAVPRHRARRRAVGFRRRAVEVGTDRSGHGSPRISPSPASGRRLPGGRARTTARPAGDGPHRNEPPRGPAAGRRQAGHQSKRRRQAGHRSERRRQADSGRSDGDRPDTGRAGAGPSVAPRTDRTDAGQPEAGRPDAGRGETDRPDDDAPGSDTDGPGDRTSGRAGFGLAAAAGAAGAAAAAAAAAGRPDATTGPGAVDRGTGPRPGAPTPSGRTGEFPRRAQAPPAGTRWAPAERFAAGTGPSAARPARARRGPGPGHTGEFRRQTASPAPARSDPASPASSAQVPPGPARPHRRVPGRRSAVRCRPAGASQSADPDPTPVSSRQAHGPPTRASPAGCRPAPPRRAPRRSARAQRATGPTTPPRARPVTAPAGGGREAGRPGPDARPTGGQAARLGTGRANRPRAGRVRGQPPGRHGRLHRPGLHGRPRRRHDHPATGSDALPRRIPGPPSPTGPGPRPESHTGQFRTDRRPGPGEVPVRQRHRRVPAAAVAGRSADPAAQPRAGPGGRAVRTARAVPRPDGQLPGGHDPNASAFDLGETTPIFEEIASAWFRSNRPVRSPGSPTPGRTPSWRRPPAAQDTDPDGVARTGPSEAAPTVGPERRQIPGRHPGRRLDVRRATGPGRRPGGRGWRHPAAAPSGAPPRRSRRPRCRRRPRLRPRFRRRRSRLPTRPPARATARQTHPGATGSTPARAHAGGLLHRGR
jgi:hypothetical protein